MKIGVGLDAALGLSFADHRVLAREVAELGYSDAWTPAGATARDSFHICAQWHGATADLDGGLTTGISVVPVPAWTPVALAMQAGTVGEITGGRFILGIGTGSIQSAAFQRAYDVPAWPPVAMMRDDLTILRGLLAGETVTHEGKAWSLRGVRLGFKPPRVPVYLAALGPQMLRLAGELSDGVLPNWCSVEQVAWIREQIATSARRVGRDPAEVPIVEYIRVCVDADEDVARRAFARAVMPYAMLPPGGNKAHGYRAHFARMGFDEALTDLEARRDAGAATDELAEAFPTELMRKVGYFGRPEGAAAAFRALAVGLDTALVRVVLARPGLDAVRRTIQSCRPELVGVG